MSIVRSDNFFFTNPKPPQAYERKQVGDTYVDWSSTAEVNAALDISFRKNKYFWINAVYYECDDDGTTYRSIGGPAIASSSFVKVPIVTTASTITIPEIDGRDIGMVVMDGIIYQDFVDNGNMIGASGDVLDMTNAGGCNAGGYIIVFFS